MVASISHDLRTPLNCVISFLHEASLEKDISRCFKEKFLEPSLNSSEYLVWLVNDILLYT